VPGKLSCLLRSTHHHPTLLESQHSSSVHAINHRFINVRDDRWNAEIRVPCHPGVFPSRIRRASSDKGVWAI
jgi:hypothetical protein